MSFDAFKPAPTEGATLQVNTDAFQRGEELNFLAQSSLTEIQGRLDFMQGVMKKDLNTQELGAAWQAVESELESSIPSTFKTAYEAEKSWQAAADRITGTILNNLNVFIGELLTDELEGTGKLGSDSRLAEIIKTVDDESWTGTVSAAERQAILKQIADSRPKKGTMSLALGGESNSKRAADDAMKLR